MARLSIEHAFHAPGHNHATCVDDALTAADVVCARRGKRLTELRRRILEIVWNSHAPVGAYDIIDALSSDGRRIVPMTVYRILAFLEEQWLIHRLESLNAYIGCGRPDEPHMVQFQICGECRSVGAVDEPLIQDAIKRSAKRTGFKVTASVIEVTGLCPNCQ